MSVDMRRYAAARVGRPVPLFDVGIRCLGLKDASPLPALAAGDGAEWRLKIPAPDPMRRRLGMSFPNKGKSFPVIGSAGGDGKRPSSAVASKICEALRRELGTTPTAAKIAMSWTGASERTVKNWFAGRYGPNEEHLVSLAAKSDAVLVTFLTLAGRTDLATTASLSDIRKRVRQMLEILDATLENSAPPIH